MEAMDSVLDEQAAKLAIQRRHIADMREIWGLQPRLEKGGRGAVRALEHLRFRAGYDFLLLRVEAGELPAELGRWWTEFVDADADARERLLAGRPGETRAGPAKRRRRRSPRREAGTMPDDVAVLPEPADAFEDGPRPGRQGGGSHRDLEPPR
jgi:poly(A) polymerase